MLTSGMKLPVLITPKRHLDSRGWFSETFHEERLAVMGIKDPFVQDNQSYSKKGGTLRGLHFQLPPAGQAKLVSVLRGRILDVAVDIRRRSPTYSKHIAVELSAGSGDQLYIPVGFAHGFITLEDDVIVTYKVSNYYAPRLDSGIRWNDPDLSIEWAFKHTDVIVSEKDRQLPFLKDLKSPFNYDGHPLEALARNTIV